MNKRKLLGIFIGIILVAIVAFVILEITNSSKDKKDSNTDSNPVSYAKGDLRYDQEAQDSFIEQLNKANAEKNNGN